LISLGIPRSDAELRQEIHPTVRSFSTLLDIAVVDRDPQVAERAAQEIVPAFNASLDQLQSQVATSQAGPRLHAIVPWEVPSQAPTTQFSPNIGRNLLYAALLGLGLGLLLVLGREYLDSSIKSLAEVRARLGWPVLGQVPAQPARRGNKKRAKLPLLATGPGQLADYFRTLRANLRFSSAGKARTLVVTSAMPAEGKSTIAANLALVSAQAGSKTILVDADFRHPSLHALFELDNVGLGDVITMENGSDTLLQRTSEPNLLVICSGRSPTDPTDLLSSESMRSLIDGFKGRADTVIFDAAPVGPVVDAAALASISDGVLMVVEQGRTPVGAILRARESLELAGASVVGVVLNRVSERDIPGYTHYRPEKAESNRSK